jgi:tight adherence protein B
LKRFALLVAVVLAVTTAVATGASAASGLRIIEAKGPAFPVRTYVLSLQHGRQLTLRNVSVTENGGRVLAPTLVPASEASAETFGAVLVLDTSYSMTGAPIQAAVAAAKAFANQLNPKEQLGLVEFNRNTTIALNLTNSASKIAAALDTAPSISTGTHIYDAVSKAEAMLNAAKINSGSVVVLSDGADTGSTHTLASVAKAAVAGNMRIYTVGLANSSYKPGTLKALAVAGHGQYAKATPQALTPFFHNLSQNLSDEYLLQYKSLAGPNKRVRVKVQVNGLGTAAPTGYRTPAIPIHNVVPGTYSPSIGTRIWSSAITAIVLALLGAGVVAFLVIGLLQPRRSGLPARMAEFVSIRSLQRDKGQASEEADPDRETPFIRLQKTLEIADIHMEPETLVAGTIAVTGLTYLLIYLGTGSPWWALFALTIPYFSREWVIRTLKRRRNRFAEQLPDALQVIASALRSGHSFAGALAVVVESASEPMKSEMQRVVADEQRAVPIQNSLEVVADRMASRDVEQLALVAQLQREAGGDAAEVVDRVAETVRERFDLKRLIHTLTMQGRMSRWIVSALPIVVIAAVELENPHYFHPLTATLGGRIVLGLAAGWAVAGSLVIKKIVEIEV